MVVAEKMQCAVDEKPRYLLLDRNPVTGRLLNGPLDRDDDVAEHIRVFHGKTEDIGGRVYLPVLPVQLFDLRVAGQEYADLAIT